MVQVVYALHDFTPENSDEVAFKAGDAIRVLEQDDEYGDGWWQGTTPQGVTGLFPVSFTTTEQNAALVNKVGVASTAAAAAAATAAGPDAAPEPAPDAVPTAHPAPASNPAPTAAIDGDLSTVPVSVPAAPAVPAVLEEPEEPKLPRKTPSPVSTFPVVPQQPLHTPRSPPSRLPPGAFRLSSSSAEPSVAAPLLHASVEPPASASASAAALPQDEVPPVSETVAYAPERAQVPAETHSDSPIRMTQQPLVHSSSSAEIGASGTMADIEAAINQFSGPEASAAPSVPANGNVAPSSLSDTGAARSLDPAQPRRQEMASTAGDASGTEDDHEDHEFGYGGLGGFSAARAALAANAQQNALSAQAEKRLEEERRTASALRFQQRDEELRMDSRNRHGKPSMSIDDPSRLSTALDGLELSDESDEDEGSSQGRLHHADAALQRPNDQRQAAPESVSYPPPTPPLFSSATMRSPLESQAQPQAHAPAQAAVQTPAHSLAQPQAASAIPQSTPASIPSQHEQVNRSGPEAQQPTSPGLQDAPRIAPSGAQPWMTTSRPVPPPPVPAATPNYCPPRSLSRQSASMRTASVQSSVQERDAPEQSFTSTVSHGPSKGHSPVVSLPPGDPAEWSVGQVTQWARSKGWDESTIVSKFAEQEISGDVLLDMDINMLKEIDIKAFGARHKIVVAIGELRQVHSEAERSWGGSHQSAVQYAPAPAPVTPVTPASAPVHLAQDSSRGHTRGSSPTQNGQRTSSVHSSDRPAPNPGFNSYAHIPSPGPVSSPLGARSVVAPNPLHPARNASWGSNPARFQTPPPSHAEHAFASPGSQRSIQPAASPAAAGPGLAEPAPVDILPNPYAEAPAAPPATRSFAATPAPAPAAAMDSPPGSTAAPAQATAAPPAPVHGPVSASAASQEPTHLSNPHDSAQPISAAPVSTPSSAVAVESGSTHPTENSTAHAEPTLHGTAGLIGGGAIAGPAGGATAGAASHRHTHTPSTELPANLPEWARREAQAEEAAAKDGHERNTSTTTGGSTAATSAHAAQPATPPAGSSPIRTEFKEDRSSSLFGGLRAGRGDKGLSRFMTMRRGGTPEKAGLLKSSISGPTNVQTSNAFVASSSSKGSAPSVASAIPAQGEGQATVMSRIRPVDREGWMKKKGERYMVWKPRYLAIKGSDMVVLRDPEATKIKGHIALKGARIMSDSSIHPGHYGLKIVHGDPTTGEKAEHSFSSDDPVAVHEWTNVLMKASIAREASAPVVSSYQAKTISLAEAQALNPPPRPPSPTSLVRTQKASVRARPDQLTAKDAQVLTGFD